MPFQDSLLRSKSRSGQSSLRQNDRLVPETALGELGASQALRTLCFNVNRLYSKILSEQGRLTLTARYLERRQASDHC